MFVDYNVHECNATAEGIKKIPGGRIKPMRRFSICMFTGVVLCLTTAVPARQNDREDLSSRIFLQRRQALMDSLGCGVAVLYSQGHETDTGYRADSHFWYLTGIDEPGAVLILAPCEDRKQTLLLPPRDMDEERWTGERPALTESLRLSLGFDRILRTGYMDRILTECLRHTSVLHMISPPAGPSTDIPPDLVLYNRIRERIPGITISNSSRFPEHMRMIKSDMEIAAIERAIQITYSGLTELLGRIEPGVTEFQLDGILESAFKKQGAQYMAFDPIVGCGRKSAILHYQKRDGTLEPGQLLLLDIGAEWHRYAADISRTLPVDGRFSPEQADIYDIVLAAQKAAFRAVRPGATVQDVDDAARSVIREAGYIDTYIHGTSHHLGLDVHDTADYGMPLQPGMVITVEPGIYLPDLQIGIRIEDDVLVTRDGCRILSQQIPRERKAVEAWMAAAGHPVSGK